MTEELRDGEADNSIELVSSTVPPRRRWRGISRPHLPRLLRQVGPADVVFVAGLGLLWHGLATVADPLPFLIVGAMLLFLGGRAPKRGR